jgi:uncharacterized protein (DUF433 family)
MFRRHGDHSGKRRVKPVEHLIEQLANGWSEADLLEACPGPAREDLQACYVRNLK